MNFIKVESFTENAPHQNFAMLATKQVGLHPLQIHFLTMLP
jgi:hypothetical protein